MSRFTLVLAAAVGLIASMLLVAPAQAAAYTVTLTLSAVKADVGQTVTLTGAVSGSGAAKKKVYVQRRLGDGPWANIGTTTTSSSKKYTYAHKVSTAGEQAFRVVAPKSGSTTLGNSPARAFTGWTWLWLAQQPHVTRGSNVWDVTINVAGVARPHSIDALTVAENGYWALYGACDDSSIVLANANGSETNVVGTVQTDEGSQSYTLTPGSRIGTDNVNQTSDYLTLSKSSGSERLIIASPRVHCNVPRLEDPEV